MQRIKHHYCWVKAHSNATAGRSEEGDPTQSNSALGSNGATMQLRWAEGGALLPAAQAMSQPPSPGSGGELRWGPKSAPLPGEAWGPKSAPSVGDEEEVAWGPKSSPPPAGEVDQGVTVASLPAADWGPKSTLSPGEAEREVAVQAESMAETMGAGFWKQRSGTKQPYWGPKSVGMQFAGATLMGGWQFEHAVVGKGGDGICLSFSVMLGDRSQALGWLADVDGQAWSSDALAISLVCFAAVGDF